MLLCSQHATLTQVATRYVATCATSSWVTATRTANDIWPLWYWVREATGERRGERWWSTVYGRSAGNSKLVAYQPQVLHFEVTAVDYCYGRDTDRKFRSSTVPPLNPVQYPQSPGYLPQRQPSSFTFSNFKILEARVDHEQPPLSIFTLFSVFFFRKLSTTDWLLCWISVVDRWKGWFINNVKNSHHTLSDHI